MTEREKLIELIQNAVGGCARHWAEVIADHLLANGVIVPPCKVGDEVYFASNKEKTVETFYVDSVEIVILKSGIHSLIQVKTRKDKFWTDYEFCDYQYGKELFFTKEEAEKALMRYKNEGNR